MSNKAVHDDDRVAQWRSLFPVTERWIYLDHAAVAPISRPVYEAMRGLLDDVLHNGVLHARRWYATYEKARIAAAYLLGTAPQRIAFAKNTSEGLNFVANGLVWSPGDEVVTAAMEFPANRFPWLNLADMGVRTRLVADEDGCVPAERLIRALTPRTRVLAISAVQYASGWRAELRTLGEMCRKQDVLFVVDGIQALGALPLSPEADYVDVLAADGHKWLLGPEGAAVVYFSKRALERLRVAEVGWASVINPNNYEEQQLRLHPDARRFECGTPTTVGLYGLGEALALINEIGIEHISKRVLGLAEYARQRCREYGWRIYGPQDEEHGSGIVSFEVGGDPVELVRAVRRRGVQLSARAGRVRISPHFYNTTEEIDCALGMLAELP